MTRVSQAFVLVRLGERSNTPSHGSCDSRGMNKSKNVVSCANVFRSHDFVMGWRMMFGEVVGQVFYSLFPIYSELFLCHAIPEPVESHIPGFGSVLLHVCCSKLEGGGIVGLHWRWRLRMVEGYKGVTDGHSSLAVVEDI